MFCKIKQFFFNELGKGNRIGQKKQNKKILVAEIYFAGAI